MGVVLKVQPGRFIFYPAQDQMLDRVVGDRTQAEGRFDPGPDLGLVKDLQQPQDLDILPLSLFPRAPFQEPAQAVELLGQVPALERRGLVQGIWFTLQDL